jgi:4-amino-4-deoxy-L-arabinose transferase-like glycosyltransferase
VTDRYQATLWAAVALVMLAAAFRLIDLTGAPPGWRDDELLDVMMNSRVGSDFHPLYFAEQEGHEPLQHYLVPAVYRLMGKNVVSHRWLEVMAGVLSVALAIPLGRHLFDRRVALLGAALLAVGFWPLMYARFGLRHILLVPLIMASAYALLRMLDEGARWRWILVAGCAVGAALLTYFAARLMPAIIAAWAIYLWVVTRQKRVAAAAVGSLAIGGLMALPMFLAIAQLPGGEDRLQVVGAPLAELVAGRPQLAIQTTLGTLGMFTFAGDPEWLYNLSGLPVFDWATGLLFYAGVALALWRWRRPREALAVLWLVGGLAPAFVSLPAASFGHTIVAQPVVYLLAAAGTVWLADWIFRRRLTRIAGVAVALVLLNGGLTVRAYWGQWNQSQWVRFFYHADIHDAAGWLNANPGLNDVSISSRVTQQVIDQVALELDLQRPVAPRLFDPEGALVWPAGAGTLLLTSAVQLNPSLAEYLDSDSLIHTERIDGGRTAFDAYRLSRPEVPPSVIARFGDGLLLRHWEAAEVPDGLVVRTWWEVERDELPVVKQFVHLLQNGVMATGNDRFDAYGPSLRAGDLVLQETHVMAPPGSYMIEIGLYDPSSNRRWTLAGEGEDRILLGPVAVGTSSSG